MFLLTFVNTVDCLFGLCSACRWILPSPYGRVSPRGLWGTPHAAISGTTLRSGGATRPSGRTTTPWCWRELLFTTSEEPGHHFTLFLTWLSGCCKNWNLGQVLLTTLAKISLHPCLSLVDVVNMCLWNQWNLLAYCIVRSDGRSASSASLRCGDILRVCWGIECVEEQQSKYFLEHRPAWFWGFPDDSDCRESTCNVGDPRFDPWVRKVPWKRAWQPIAVFLPREYPGQWSLAGYSP